MRALALPCSLAIALSGFALLTRQNPVLIRTFLGTGGALLLWTFALYAKSRQSHRTLSIAVDIRRQHWLQACAQGTVLLYWGWHTPIVYAFLPLIFAQLVFAYAFDALLTWSRRDKYAIGFGAFPIIFSINLFLWFRLDWFYWQFAMIAVGYLAKEFIRWNKDGRSAHIFNPSSFPLAVASLGLLLTGTSNITYGAIIANTQFDTHYIYLVIFLVALPAQILFGVARMTLAAVITMFAISLAYFAATGTYLFYDAHIPVPVFLGMHLLFTDPSTSPKSELGRIIYGMLYATLTVAFFVLLSSLGAPTFYDKLLPVPLMNLMVRRIDRLTSVKPLAMLDPSRLGSALSVRQRSVVYTSLWAALFVALSAVQGVGDKHPGQYLPFWQRACDAGSERACNYAANLLVIYCNTGSGWACNEVGIRRLELQQSGDADFRRGCELGFAPACTNLNGTNASVAARTGPPLKELPIVLRGTKPVLRERDPATLYALACEQGWKELCPPAGNPQQG
ncbi:MAG: hypothetical protein ACREOG_20580 [Gemmatimonadaceae bacterium]